MQVFHCLHKKKTVSHPCLVLKRWCLLKATRIKKKDFYEEKKYNLLVWLMVIPVLTWLDRWKKWSNSLEVLLVLLSYIQAKTRTLFLASVNACFVTYLARCSNKALLTKAVEMSGILCTSISVVTFPVSAWGLKVATSPLVFYNVKI